MSYPICIRRESKQRKGVVIFSQKTLISEFKKAQHKKNEYGSCHSDLEDTNQRLAIKILEDEINHFNGQATTYFLILGVIFLLFFAIQAPSYGYLPGAAICALLLTPQLLKFHYRMRQFKIAEDTCSEQQLKKIIYFADAHSKTAMPKMYLPRSRSRFWEDTAPSNFQKEIINFFSNFKSTKAKSVQFAFTEKGFKIIFYTKSYFLSGSQRVEIQFTETAEDIEVLVSSYPRQRRRTIELGRNKINVLLFHQAFITFLQDILKRRDASSFLVKPLNADKIKSFAPEHLPIPLDRIA